jgi:hypothetical protein
VQTSSSSTRYRVDGSFSNLALGLTDCYPIRAETALVLIAARTDFEVSAPVARYTLFKEIVLRSKDCVIFFDPKEEDAGFKIRRIKSVVNRRDEVESVIWSVAEGGKIGWNE